MSLKDKVKKQMPRKPSEKLRGIMPDECTGIDVITGTTFKKQRSGKTFKGQRPKIRGKR